MKSLILLVTILGLLGFVGCANNPEEEVKEVIDNYIEIMRSGDCSRAEKYIIGDELLSEVKKSASADSKPLDKMKLGEFEICVEKNEAVVIVATQIVDKYKARKRGYINFYLKKVDVSGDIDESGDWKIDCHFYSEKPISCTIKGYMKAEKESREKFNKLKARSMVMHLDLLVMDYEMDYRKSPRSLNQLFAIAKRKKSKIKLEESDLIDPWGNEFKLNVSGKRCFVVCAGPDGVFDTGDDITARE